jgi:hypothetical protein
VGKRSKHDPCPRCGGLRVPVYGPVQISGETFAGIVAIPAFKYARVCGCYVVKPG